MATRLIPALYQVFKNDGTVGNGYKLYFYEAGSTTLKDTYSDEALSVVNSNPVVADGNGRFGNIFGIDKEDYKIVLTDNSITPVTIKTEDPIDATTYNVNSFSPRPFQFWGTTTNTASAYKIKPSQSITAYTNDITFSIQVHLNNNAACTLAVFEEGTESTYLSALPMKKYNGAGSLIALEASDLLSGNTYNIRIDATNVIVFNPEKPYIKDLNVINDLLISGNTSIKTLSFPQTTQTISSGNITPLSYNVKVDGEGASSDNLDNIVITEIPDFTIFRITNAEQTNIITVRDNSVSGGNINLMYNRNVVLKFPNLDYLEVIKIGSQLIEYGRNIHSDFGDNVSSYYLPNNRLVQFGSYTGGGHGPTITFSIAFDSIQSIVGTCISSADQSIAIHNVSTSSFIAHQFNASATPINADFYWIAIGIKQQ